MKAISLWQPWASALFVSVPGGGVLKSIETRHWRTDYRGDLLIHAAKRWTAEEREWYARLCRQNPLWPAEPPLGCLIGVVRMIDCKRTEEVRDEISDTESHWGNYGDHRFGWIFEAPRLLPKPIPYRGQQGFFDVPDEEWNRS